MFLQKEFYLFYKTAGHLTLLAAVNVLEAIR